MLASVGREVPDDDIAKAVFYLVKEVGISHEEIFGGTEYVNFVEEVERDGLLGRILGDKKLVTTEEVETKGMDLRTFSAYLELYQEHQKEKEKHRKKQGMRQNLKGKTFA